LHRPVKDIKKNSGHTVELFRLLQRFLWFRTFQGFYTVQSLRIGMNIIEVVAGLIVRGDRLLVCQRREDGSFPLKWEFPGGKVELDERHEEALLRELKEELGIEAHGPKEIFRHRQTYPGAATVNLRFYTVGAFSGCIRNIVFQNIAWLLCRELARLDWLEGDLPLVRYLMSPEGQGRLF
jgi:8-oxo-dGTP diphosphatase